MANYNLALPFWRASLRFPERVALVAERCLSYQQMAAQAQAVADFVGPARGRVVVLGSRSAASAVAILGCCWAGATYVPVHPGWPEERICELLRQLQAEALLVDEEGRSALREAVLRAAPARIYDPLELAAVAPREPAALEADSIAYVIFTSGTTGRPKGVMVEAGAVCHLVEQSQEWFGLTPEDRVGSNFEISFDGSVFDMFLTWNAGAGLFVVPRAQAMAPQGWIRRHQLSLCVLTPSVVSFMRRLKALQPGSLPSLRWSLFGAEALPAGDAAEWLQVAPQSRLCSLYGPTENTVTSMVQPVTDPVVVTPERNTIPLGRPLAGIQAKIVDSEGHPLEAGQVGELVLQGAQLAAGYLDEAELTEERFPRLQGVRSYRTGDRAYRDQAGLYHHVGRTDHQVKIRGYRVELEEVESALRTITGSGQVAALAWPDQPGSWNRIEAFVSGASLSPADIQERLRARLPSYALPARISVLATLPYLESGKIDRTALAAWLTQHG